ncbi:arylesterase [Methylocella tundrae]|uniref:Multifunctional acyl-CoA thioesterase I and protease I and lysophospholipase L1 (Modular protein) n=1 Tax=Methylocella tundrae TaxID=227605 RepID=A0A4U8Z584_METTU|nr:arylesterase [Methylocella tundrae]VFU10683.1 multifunctional acyl-CoA thioesterase I and protease I and lysophospholipase L1 (modular protein) [Methylocella tundrae]
MTSKTPPQTDPRRLNSPAQAPIANARAEPVRYRDRRDFLQGVLQTGAALLLALPLDAGRRSAAAEENPRVTKLIAFGDSLTAGYLLPANAAFPAVLETALHKEGYRVAIANAGVSGDTSSGGLARLDWAIGDGADGLILELGANDMLRGTDPKVTKSALEAILAKLKEKDVKVLLAGMLASPNLGKDYQTQFDAIYPELAAEYGALFYPFFLDGVADRPDLKLADGLHPNPDGVKEIVQNILPSVRALLAELGDKPARG